MQPSSKGDGQMKYVLFLVCLALSGCAVTVTSSTPRSVMINAAPAQAAEAANAAEVECQKFGRHARLIERPRPFNPEFIFDCVN
jgi:hypothetical protein